MIWLDHDESRSYDVMLRVLDGAEEIATAEARITSIARQPSDGFPNRPAGFQLSGARRDERIGACARQTHRDL